MPTKHKALITLRGTDEYRRFLDRLLAEVKAEGIRINETPHGLAEYALAVLGLHHGLKAPRRVPPMGTNGHGEPAAD